MAEFHKLINEIKNDLSSLPSVDGKTPQTKPYDTRSTTSSSREKLKTSSSSLLKGVSVKKWFLKHIFLSVEIFVFFFILLIVTKPSFLYVRKRTPANRHEIVPKRFSVISLLMYCIVFTLFMHGMIWFHQFLVRRYL